LSPHLCERVFADGRVEEENGAAQCAIPVLSSADLCGFLVVPFTKAKARPKPAGFFCEVVARANVHFGI